MSFLSSFLKNDSSQPTADQVEISLFGAGVGECIVVHIANGDWIVVDSCQYNETKNPVALEYLSAIGVDVKSRVRQVVVSHWHDDHVRGISNVARHCEEADIVCSAAIRSTEFLTLIALQGKHKPILETISTGVDEFREIFEIAKARATPQGRSPFQWATSSKTLYRSASCATSATITSLSPSDGEQMRSLLEFQNLIPVSPGDPKRRAIANSPNETAIVLWIEVGAVSVLLGSDLEHSASSDRGWRHIVSSQTRPRGRANIFKIPHHGSKNAHCHEVWDSMLHSAPYAILTPYNPSYLPQEPDVERILSYTKSAFFAGARSAKKVKRESAVDKALREHVVHHRTIEGRLGLVRLRCNSETGDPTEKQLFGAASCLQMPSPQPDVV